MDPLLVNIVDLPPELRTEIIRKIPLRVLRTFRLVCVNNRYLYDNLYQIITDDINMRDTLKIYLYDNQQRCTKILQDFKFLVKSSIKMISLDLPNWYGLSHTANLRAKLIDMINVSHDKIHQISIGYFVPRDALEEFLPQLTKLKKIRIDDSENTMLYQQLIKNHCGSVEKLELEDMTFTDEVTFSEMPKLTEIYLGACRGNTGLRSLLSRASNMKKVTLENLDIDASTVGTIGNMEKLEELELLHCRGKISTLLSRASNLKKVTLDNLYIDAATVGTIGNMEKLEELELGECRGEVSNLLMAVAPNVSTLVLDQIRENIAVEVPFSKLTKVKLQNCSGEISSVLTQAAPYITSLQLYRIDMNTLVNKAFRKLKEVIIRRDNRIPAGSMYVCQEIDISESVLLTRGGRLQEFSSKVKRIWSEDWKGNRID